jgi:hypothetical protein
LALFLQRANNKSGNNVSGNENGVVAGENKRGFGENIIPMPDQKNRGNQQFFDLDES